jgi:hypothetical protein
MDVYGSINWNSIRIVRKRFAQFMYLATVATQFKIVCFCVIPECSTTKYCIGLQFKCELYEVGVASKID